MKVRAIVNYNDLQLNKLVKLGEELEVTKERAERLVEAKVAIMVTTPTTEKKTGGRKKKDEAK